MLATGSSTLAATKKFRNFYARDIQELFGIRSRTGFMKLLHLLFRQNGSLIDYTNLARLSELSRYTVRAHVEAMGIAHAVFLLPPFQGGGRREITHRPKCYAFDTGFVTFVKGWDSIREDDRGILWEHLVLDMLRTLLGNDAVFYLRDKSGREVDFVIKGRRQQTSAIECKINSDHFDPANLLIIRSIYPEGKNYVLSPNIKSSYQRRYEKLQIHFISVFDLFTINW
ncbi:MAG: DUF4143 domain-containing protein [Syntrophaceae bacterium]